MLEFSLELLLLLKLESFLLFGDLLVVDRLVKGGREAAGGKATMSSGASPSSPLGASLGYLPLCLTERLLLKSCSRLWDGGGLRKGVEWWNDSRRRRVFRSLNLDQAHLPFPPFRLLQTATTSVSSSEMAFGFKKKEEKKSVVLAHFMVGSGAV